MHERYHHPIDSFQSLRNFEIKMYSEYQQMQKEFGFCVIEGNQSIFIAAMCGTRRMVGIDCSAAMQVLYLTRLVKKDNGFLEIEIGRDLRIIKCTLVSGCTEMLYHRQHFGEMLVERQQRATANSLDSNASAPVHEKDTDVGPSKVRKSKGKK